MNPITLANANPVAAPKSQFVHGCARFTVLSESMIRMEYAADGCFEDRGTLAVINRRTPTPAYKVTRSKETITLRTANLVLTYQETGRGFSAKNLSVTFRLNGKKTTWQFGQKDKANLGGTVRTLDGADGNMAWLWKQNEQGHWSRDRKVPLVLEPGFLSRNGWVVVDDSTSLVLDPSTEAMTPWPTPRASGKRQDLYFLGHGLDFKVALADAALVFGSQPLPPRYALGYWYSRYWAYTDREIEDMVDQFDRMGLPIDVMVIDMDWHKQGWTGYSWDRDYFPDPTALLRSLRSRGVKITLNLHPADGVGRHEDAFPAMCRDLGLDPATTERIPFDCTDPAFVASYFKRLHHPEEKRGVDFWWLDWQQGSKTSLEGLDPLPWLNHLHWVDQLQHSAPRRPFNFSRYGGPGAGRYPVGFSGDTHSTWESLAYQPYFTATAANALYGTWSHDIGGHQPGPISPELYTRWIQFGVYSPILRTHTSKNREAERRIWIYPEPYRDIMMAALHERYHLIPYIYTEFHKTLDHALSLVRPMYLEHPTEEEAYRVPGQYYFGDAMIIAPITREVDPATEMASATVWLPPGAWYHVTHGELVRGGQLLQRDYLIDEVPVFVKAGAILPGQGPTARTQPGSYPHLTLHAYPGGSGEYTCYEDDGITNGYLAGESVMIPMAHRTGKNQRTITLGPAKGAFKGFKPKRTITLYLHGSAPADRVTVNGRAVRPEYDGDDGTVIVDMKSIDLTKPTTIELTASSSASRRFAQGWKGLMHRLIKIGTYANLVSPPHPVHPEERLAIRLAQTGNRLTRWPEKAEEELREFNRHLKRLPQALEGFQTEYRLRNQLDEVAILEKARTLLDLSHPR